MDAQDILRDAARTAGLTPKNAKNVIDLADQVRAKGPLNAAKRATASERLFEIFPGLRGPRH
ncbi:MAG: hypothetical protein QOJ25_201 [Solirubrobacteraceae bacterium]|jgi:hypothetical protein|nr:hypothetical protein [Solirubrobacteraceae bacterium]